MKRQYLSIKEDIRSLNRWKHAGGKLREPGPKALSTDYTAIRTLKIPLPPLSIQRQIAEEVNARRQKAKKLKEEAKEILAKAKEKVEKMIFGGD